MTLATGPRFLPGPALLHLFFPDANEALLWKQRRSAVRSKPKASAKAQHSLRNHSRFCGLLLLLAWARSRGGRNPHTAKASLPGHLLCESTAFVGKSEWGLRMLLLLA